MRIRAAFTKCSLNCQNVDVIRVKSYVDSFLDPTGVPVRVSINKLYLVPRPACLVPKRIMAGLVGVLRNGGGLGTGESYIPVVLFDSLGIDLPVSPLPVCRLYRIYKLKIKILFYKIVVWDPDRQLL